jgi:hypothetical protein
MAPMNGRPALMGGYKRATYPPGLGFYEELLGAAHRRAWSPFTFLHSAHTLVEGTSWIASELSPSAYRPSRPTPSRVGADAPVRFLPPYQRMRPTRPHLREDRPGFALPICPRSCPGRARQWRLRDRRRRPRTLAPQRTPPKTPEGSCLDDAVPSKGASSRPAKMLPPRPRFGSDPHLTPIWRLDFIGRRPLPVPSRSPLRTRGLPLATLDLSRSGERPPRDSHPRGIRFPCHHRPGHQRELARWGLCPSLPRPFHIWRRGEGSGEPGVGTPRRRPSRPPSLSRSSRDSRPTLRSATMDRAKEGQRSKDRTTASRQRGEAGAKPSSLSPPCSHCRPRPPCRPRTSGYRPRGPLPNAHPPEASPVHSAPSFVVAAPRASPPDRLQGPGSRRPDLLGEPFPNVDPLSEMWCDHRTPEKDGPKVLLCCLRMVDGPAVQRGRERGNDRSPAIRRGTWRSPT